MDEFSLIETCFAPLARHFPGSLNLEDDAAVIAAPPGCELVVTTDAISEGVHFIGDEDAALIAKKLVRVNLSDLAAMGATPLCYFLTVMLPKAPLPNPPPQAGEGKESPLSPKGGGLERGPWLQRFAEGLAEDQQEFHIHLAGGDTLSTYGAKSFSITALGTVPAGKALKRSGAKAGDSIYVSGTLGDSALGLSSLRESEATAAIQNVATDWIASASPRNDDAFLIRRYLLPEPRLALGRKLIGTATACMDISDGLVQDLGHICKASGIGATIYRDKLPLSPPAQKLIAQDERYWDDVLGGGDDYELLFTASPGKKPEVKKLADELNLPLTQIGTLIEGKEVKVLGEMGKALEIKRKGFRHF